MTELTMSGLMGVEQTDSTHDLVGSTAMRVDARQAGLKLELSAVNAIKRKSQLT
jgi:hypothetical protein